MEGLSPSSFTLSSKAAVLDRKPGLIADLWRQYFLKIGLIEKRLLVSPVLDLVNEDIARPSEPLGGPDVEFALGCVLALLQYHGVVRPRNLSHQRCEFFVEAVALMEKLHSPKVSGRKAAGARKFGM